MRLLLAIGVLLGVGTGCRVGQTIAYDRVTPVLRAKAPLVIGVAVSDERKEILDGRKRPRFVGLLRGGYGNPWDVETSSGKPLGHDLETAMTRGLMARGYQVQHLVVEPGWTRHDVAREAARVGASRALLVRLAAWRSDAKVRVRLNYDLVVNVVDVPSAAIVGNNFVMGEDVFMSTYEMAFYMKDTLPRLFREKLEELLNEPLIVRALSPAPALADAAAPTSESSPR
jgi:hypothetical protein